MAAKTPAPPPRAEPIPVLHLIKSLAVVGGAERLLLSLSAAGDGARFEYHVAHVLPNPSEHLVGDLAAAGVRVHDLGAKSQYDLRWLFRLRSLVIAQRIAVLHLHLPYAAGLGRIVPWTIAGRPVIVHTQHNIWCHNALVMRGLMRATYRLDDADIAVSKTVWASLPDTVQARTQVLVHGLPLPAFEEPEVLRKDVRSEFDVHDGELLVTAVANFRSEKGYDVLLEAIRRLAERQAPVRFVAVGDGPLRDDVAAARDELGLADRLVLTGYRSDVERILAGSDLFVLASHHEGFPIAVMEALAVGVPVVSTEVGDVPDAVANGSGVIVPRGDPAALASAIEALLLDPDRRMRMAEAARAAGEQFDINRVSRRLEDLYVSLLRADTSPATAGT